ncbi:MAG: cupin domain-containing protein [Burkholderiales bacterium]
MAFQIRRVITGHDAKGKANVLIDRLETTPKAGRPGALLHNIWSTDTSPANNDGQDDRGAVPMGTAMPNGTIFRVIDFQPGVQARMHRTDTIDYLVVMSGEIDMELDDGVEVHLKAGDVMVQRGTIHNWVNRGTASCIIAVILVDAKSVEAGGSVLPAHG